MTPRDWQKDMEIQIKMKNCAQRSGFKTEEEDAAIYWMIQAKEYGEREQEIKRAIGRCLVAGNSLGSVIMSYNLPSGHEDWTFQQASTFFYETYARETAYERYEIWLAWTAIMGVSQNLSTLYPDTPAQPAESKGDMTPIKPIRPTTAVLSEEEAERSAPKRITQ